MTELVELVAAIDPALPQRAGTAWPLAQALAHCAQSIEYSLTGYPQLRSGLFRATIGPIAKKKFIRANRMSHDIAAPVAGAPALEGVAVGDAKARLVAAVAAFVAHDGPLAPHLAYGACTKPEYAVLHRLHVEDHLRGYGA